MMMTQAAAIDEIHGVSGNQISSVGFLIRIFMYSLSNPRSHHLLTYTLSNNTFVMSPGNARGSMANEAAAPPASSLNAATN